MTTRDLILTLSVAALRAVWRMMDPSSALQVFRDGLPSCLFWVSTVELLLEEGWEAYCKLYRGFPTRMVYLKHDIVKIHLSGREPSICPCQLPVLCLDCLFSIAYPSCVLWLFFVDCIWPRDCEDVPQALVFNHLVVFVSQPSDL